MLKPPALVKICGTRDIVGAEAAVGAGADFIGFIFHPPARRYVAPETARSILGQLQRRSSIRAVGIFVNTSPHQINEIAQHCGLDLVQLSGQESATDVLHLKRPVIRAFRPTVQHPELPRLDAQVFAALLEPSGVGWGGSGQQTDWTLAQRIVAQAERPQVFLAGGLSPENVVQAIAAVQPDGVDVSSGIETNGTQDPLRIAAFVAAVKGILR